MKLAKIKEIIKESYVKDEDCGCGGNCGQAPLLLESQAKPLLSEGLQYHINNEIPLFEPIYRYGSDRHLLLIKEARRMYSRGVIDLGEDDKSLIETNLGEFGVYRGVEVPLDFPMLTEVKVGATYAGRPVTVIKVNPTDETTWKVRFANGKEVDFADTLANIKFNEDLNESLEAAIAKEKKDNERNIDVDIATRELRQIEYYLKDPKKYPLGDSAKRALARLKKKHGVEEQLDEKKKAKSQKKDPPLGKPKRGGSKAYYVYVRDPKTKRIKKVSFGSGGLRAKIKDRGAKSAFAKRHRCSEKNDRTKPSYWSCRLPRYAQALGLGSNSNTFW